MGNQKSAIVQVVIGALGSVSKGYNKRIQKLEIPCNVIDMQKIALLGTASIRNVNMEEGPPDSPWSLAMTQQTEVTTTPENPTTSIDKYSLYST